ncbi:MAG: hypothetical protein WEB52_01060 [Dehalococcoidia bacterium]
MSRIDGFAAARAAAFGIFCLSSVAFVACGSIPYAGDPAAGYVYNSGAPLHVAVVDETGGNDWSPSLQSAIDQYAGATPHLRFQPARAGANIVITVRRYDDARPPELRGYRFQPGVGGFAAVYDADGTACNFPPSTVPVACSGEIASAQIYLNDIIPAGEDIEARRLRLILHELGHALGLTRHSPELGIPQLTQRYGW